MDRKGGILGISLWTTRGGFHSSSPASPDSAADLRFRGHGPSIGTGTPWIGTGAVPSDRVPRIGPGTVGWVHVSIDELVAAYAGDERSHPDGRPWLFVNMIASIDGAVAIDGVSGGLGGPADMAVFSTLRGLADVVLVAAGTVRAEGYRPPRPAAATVDARRSRGQADRPMIAVVTRSLDLDPASALFADPDYRPTVVTIASAPADRRARLEEVADVVVAGEDDIDLAHALGAVADRHGHLVLGEGGPTLNAALAAADLVHELCVTISPTVIGGDAPRLVDGDHRHEPRRFRIDRVLAADDLLFTRYLRSAD